MKFEYCVKNKNTFFIKQNISSFLFLFKEKYFFKITNNSIAIAFFAEANTKNIDLPCQNP